MKSASSQLPKPAFDTKRGQQAQLPPTPATPIPQRKQLAGNS